MKCHGCGSAMLIDRSEFDGHASTCWHRCTLCGKVRLVSSPAEESLEAYDEPLENAYADEPAAIGNDDTLNPAWRI